MIVKFKESADFKYYEQVYSYLIEKCNKMGFKHDFTFVDYFKDFRSKWILDKMIEKHVIDSKFITHMVDDFGYSWYSDVNIDWPTISTELSKFYNKDKKETTDIINCFLVNYILENKCVSRVLSGSFPMSVTVLPVKSSRRNLSFLKDNDTYEKEIDKNSEAYQCYEDIINICEDEIIVESVKKLAELTGIVLKEKKEEN